MKKVLLGVVVVAVVGLAVWQAHQRIVAARGQQGPQRTGAPVPVETQPIRRGEIRDVGVFTGSLSPKSQFTVAPKVAGWLKELLVDIGDSVGRNEVIAILDDEQFARQVEQAAAELQVAKANVENSASDLDLAKREYERVKALREKQIASAAEMDTASAAYSAAQTRMKVAQAQAEQKEAAFKVAQLQLSYTKVQAFWEDAPSMKNDGSVRTEAPPAPSASNPPSSINHHQPCRVVGERFVDEGALVSVNQPIVSILENDPLVAVVFVIERDYPKMSIGQEAAVTTDAYPGKTFTGAIRRIAPLLRETSRQARVEIEIANPDHLLKPGMFVRAQVEFGRHEEATLIPLSALVRRGGKEGVFLVDGAEAGGTGDGGASPAPRALQTPSPSGPPLQVRFVPVTTGIASGEVLEVVEPALSGLVVTLGNHLLEDGSRVILPKPLPDARDAANDEPRATSDGKKQGGAR